MVPVYRLWLLTNKFLHSWQRQNFLWYICAESLRPLILTALYSSRVFSLAIMTSELYLWYWFLNPRHSCSRAKLRAGAPLYGSAHVCSPNSSSSAASSTATPARSSSSLCSSCPPSVSASSPPSSTRALSSSGSRVSHLTILSIFLLKNLKEISLCFYSVCLSFQLLASSLCFLLKQSLRIRFKSPHSIF